MPVTAIDVKSPDTTAVPLDEVADAICHGDAAAKEIVVELIVEFPGLVFKMVAVRTPETPTFDIVSVKILSGPAAEIAGANVTMTTANNAADNCLITFMLSPLYGPNGQARCVAWYWHSEGICSDYSADRILP